MENSKSMPCVSQDKSMKGVIAQSDPKPCANKCAAMAEVKAKKEALKNNNNGTA